jgi:predicted 3-demethylubiquinone-9 3-methyltransferase (glyoxalase superfamily)
MPMLFGGKEADIMKKIIPHLWYDKEAVEAVKWYIELFEDSKILHIDTIYDTPSGDAQTVDFELAGMQFLAISAGPYFTFNPSISLMVACSNEEEVNRLHVSLSDKGTELMPLGEYPFSKWYAWIQDKYGLSWQLMMVENMEEHQRIRPTLLFAGEVCGKAKDALDYYQTVFQEAKKGYVNYYQGEEGIDERAHINYGELSIKGNQFIIMDHGMGGDFTFNEAFSFMIPCTDQDEIDYFWDRLSFVPEAEQCGWVKDQFGLSWQIVPENLNEMMANGTKEEIKRITETFLKMKKLDIAAIERARKGE